MAILTGAYKDKHVDDAVLEAVVRLPDCDKIDEQLYLRSVVSSVDAKVMIAYLLILLDYKKTEVAFILGKSPSWIYKTFIPKLKKFQKEKENE